MSERGETWYIFRQINSGGYFIGPQAVVVDAPDPERAIEIAQQHGVDFDGPVCSCCSGEVRWCLLDDDDTETGEEFASSLEEAALLVRPYGDSPPLLRTVAATGVATDYNTREQLRELLPPPRGRR